MLPDSIPSAYDEDQNEVDDGESLDFNLVIGRNSIRYVSDNGVCRLSASGACLLDAAVDMMEKILKESYYLYDNNGKDEWYDE